MLLFLRIVLTNVFYTLRSHRPSFAPKTSLAGLPSVIPSRPLKENKAKVIPNYVKKARKEAEYEAASEQDEDQGNLPKAFVKPQRQEAMAPKATPFRTASHQLAMNVLKKNPSLARKQGVYNSFKPPLQKSEDPQSSSPQEESDKLVDERYKNIDPKMIELIENEIMDHGQPVDWDDVAGKNQCAFYYVVNLALLDYRLGICQDNSEGNRRFSPFKTRYFSRPSRSSQRSFAVWTARHRQDFDRQMHSQPIKIDLFLHQCVILDLEVGRRRRENGACSLCRGSSASAFSRFY